MSNRVFTPPQRKIIHVDMDAFFAAVEERDHPEYRGRPLVVGGKADSRGVVATCNYTARRYGIHSAMPAARARRLCPDAVFVPPRFEAYREVSRQIHTVFQAYTCLIEPLSLDEAYLDVTACQQENGSAIRIAGAIRREIQAVTQLTASAGVSYNKFLAKTASDIDKPDGLTVILPEQGEAFVAQLPIGRFYGIGKATEAKMKDLGIHNGADLREWPLEALQQHFGKSGEWYFQIARGVDPRPVVSHRQRKSIGAETTFSRDLRDPNQMLEKLRELAAEVAAGLRNKKLKARTLTIKVKYANFQQVTRSHSFDRPFWQLEGMLPWLAPLLEKTEAGEKPVRLLGVTASSLRLDTDCSRPEQMSLF